MLGWMYFYHLYLFLFYSLHVRLHVLYLLCEVADVVVGLFNAVVYEVDQVVDLVYLQLL